MFCVVGTTALTVAVNKGPPIDRPGLSVPVFRYGLLNQTLVIERPCQGRV